MSKAIFILPPHESDLDSFKLPPWKVSRIPPIGLITIASYLNSKGHDVRVVDSRAIIMEHKTRDYLPIILKTIEEFKPDMVGINMLTALFDGAKIISCEIKQEFPNLLLIAGGVHPTVESDLTFQQNPYIDAICMGAGEEVCLDILDGEKLTNIPGLLVRGYTDRFVHRPVELNIDKYPFPDFHLGDSNFYTAFNVGTLQGWGYCGLSVLTSRSCPYSCKFCASDWSKPFRYHSPEYVVEMAKYLLTYDIDVISFWDDTIAARKDRLYEICHRFIKAKLFYPTTNKRWYGAMRVNQVDPDVLKLMKEAGCFGISIGIESGSDKMLKILNKKTTVKMNRQACTMVKDVGLSLGAAFMLGIPGETEDDMNETITFMRDTTCQAKGIGSFRPLPGSPFYDEFIGDGRLFKKVINWSNLGNFTTAPDHLFCDVSEEKFEKIFDKATNIAYKNHWVAIHEDILSKYPNEIKGIASKIKIKASRSPNYESSTHISYAPFSMSLIYNTLFLILYNLIPFGLRKQLRRVRTI